jgi:PPOX class F420-dependent enzyme/OxyR family protein/uncharacterized protein (TIGR02246 family)
MPIDQAHLDYLTSQRLGRLATVAPDGTPQNKPVGYRFDRELGTIDIGGFSMETSAKFRNVAVRPDVSFVIDDAIGEGAGGMRCVEVRGRAEQVRLDAPPDGVSSHVIRIHPRRIVSWNIGGGDPRMQAFDLDGPSAGAPSRPAAGLEAAASRAAATAVAGLVGELQAGLDSHDAELSNRHFAADVIWGSPYGATVAGYEDLHAIHVRLKRERVAGPSRFEIVQVLCPAPDVAVAHVRRTALDDAGRPVPATADPGAPFSEMALYVLVRRAGQWWLAAGQNTPVRPAPQPSGQLAPRQ